jgi:hypothetical protein
VPFLFWLPMIVWSGLWSVAEDGAQTTLKARSSK